MAETPCCPPAGKTQKYTIWVKVEKQEMGPGCCGADSTHPVASVAGKVTFAASGSVITDPDNRFSTAGFQVGMWITITGSKLNNCVRKIATGGVAAGTLTVEGTLVDESTATDQVAITGTYIPECCNYGIEPDGDVCHHLELSWLCNDLKVPLENGETGEVVAAGSEKPRTNVWGNQDAGPRGTSFWRLWKKPNGKWQLFNVCHQLCHVDDSATLWPMPGQEAVICSATGTFKFTGNETATPNTIERPSGTFTTDGLKAGMSIKIEDTLKNNVFRTIESIDDANHTMKVTHLVWTESVSNATIMSGLTTTKFYSEETEWDGVSPKTFTMMHGYKAVVVAPAKPVPDFCAPQRHWQAGHPDDLNDAPFWPTLDIPLMEDSDFAPVRYFNGELQLRVKDIGSNGFGVPWGHTRIYSNQLSFSADVGNGTNWLIHEQPYLKQETFDACCMPEPTIRALDKKSPVIPRPATGQTIVMVRGTRNSLWFDEYVHQKYPTSTDTDKQKEMVKTWEARFGAKHRLIPKEAALDRTILIVAPNGHQWEFHDFHCEREETDPPPGSLKRHIGPGGQETILVYTNGRLQKAVRKCKMLAQSAFNLTITDANKLSGQIITETYVYQYFESGANKHRLSSITLYRNDRPVPPTHRPHIDWAPVITDEPQSETGPPPGSAFRRVEYVYYDEEDKHGQTGDLKMVATQVYAEDADGKPNGSSSTKPKNLEVSYYRYETEKNKEEGHCQGLLKYVLNPEAFRRLIKLGKVGIADTRVQAAAAECDPKNLKVPISFHPPSPKLGEMDDELTKIANVGNLATFAREIDQFDDSLLDRIADLHIEYNEDRRVKAIMMNGGKRTHIFNYQDNIPENFNIWSTQTVETRADGNSRTVYTNAIGQVLASTLAGKQGSGTGPSAGPPKQWSQFFVYDPWQGHLLSKSGPAGVSVTDVQQLADYVFKNREEDVSIYPHKQRTLYRVYSHSTGAGQAVGDNNSSDEDQGYEGYIDELKKEPELMKRIPDFIRQLMHSRIPRLTSETTDHAGFTAHFGNGIHQILRLSVYNGVVRQVVLWATALPSPQNFRLGDAPLDLPPYQSPPDFKENKPPFPRTFRDTSRFIYANHWFRFDIGVGDVQPLWPLH
ncbi:MAG: hypothetical protein K8T91_14160 [Planctomycetes bacterium]|nr:hypothetical protein [Planctomycetota bacterium]